MKYFFLLWMWLFCCPFLLSAQDEVPSDTVSYLQRMEISCRIWGYLKYVHPNLAKGNTDWDAVLFTYLPQIEQTPDRAAFMQLMENLFREAGPVKGKTIQQPKTESTRNSQSDPYNWIQNSPFLSPTLRAGLKKTSLTRKVKNPHYAGSIYAKGGPFANEVVYGPNPYPDQAHRTLAFFRYWNAIEYRFPYKSLNKNSWDESLTTFLPRILFAEDTTAYQHAFSELFTQLADGHADGSYSAWLLNQSIGKRMLPFRAMEIENKVVIVQASHASLFTGSPFQIGDEVLAVAGKPVEEILAGVSPYVPASNPGGKSKGKVLRLFRSNQDSLCLTLVRKTDTLEVCAATYSIAAATAPVDTARNLTDLGDQLAYINMGEIEISEVAATFEKLAAYEGVIFDLRWYPRQTSLEWSRYLFTEPTPFIRYTFPDEQHPGTFTLSDPWKTATPDKGGKGFDKPIVILVDEFTQSQGEYSAMLFQAHPRTLTVGRPTAGTDGSIVRLALPGGLVAVWSGFGVFYPDRTATQVTGVKIDYPVAVSAEALKAGKDPILEEGIQILRLQLGLE